MASTPSYRLKLYRAEEHLRDLKAVLGPDLGQRKTYPTTEAFESDEDGSRWCYRITTGYEVAERAPILAGDFMFNVRSALDHLVCALIPGEDKGNAQFPIFVEDPFATDSRGKPLNGHAPGLWKRYTKGVPKPARAVLKRLQPYWRAVEHGKPAEHQVLAILHSLQNADKHCQPVLIPDGLRQCEVIVNGQVDECITPVVKNGTPVYISETKVQVEVEGALTVSIGKGMDGLYPFPGGFEMMLDFIANEVLPPLEKLLPGQAAHQAAPPAG